MEAHRAPGSENVCQGAHSPASGATRAHNSGGQIGAPCHNDRGWHGPSLVLEQTADDEEDLNAAAREAATPLGGQGFAGVHFGALPRTMLPPVKRVSLVCGPTGTPVGRLFHTDEWE